jgi:phosphohistidine phosphatase
MAATRSLYLFRHAIAADPGGKWPDDAERPLTHDGAARLRSGVRGLAALEVDLDVVLSSPLVRAVATAEIVARGLASKAEIVTLPILAPGGAPGRVAEALAPYTKAAGIAIVGHEPGIGELAAWLIGARTPLPFKKGAACRIDVEEWPPVARQGTLVWFATPKMLRSMGG